MKAILIVISSFLTCSILADIRNGYQQELYLAQQSLQNLTELMEKSASEDSEELLYTLKSHYLRAKQTYKHLNSYYLKTEALIELLLLTDPEYYADLEHISNYYEQVTDVYIKVMPGDQMNHNQFGTTNLQQAADDPHVYQSSYGRNSVAVKIRECSPSKQLRLLVHELAHVKYQVPNLAAYAEYFRQSYGGFAETDAYGHLKNDPSNQSVIGELSAFRSRANEKGKLSKREILVLGH